MQKRRRARDFSRALSLCALACVPLVFAACGGGGGGAPAPATVAPPSSSDTELAAIAKTSLGLTGDPAAPRNAVRVIPDSDPLVKLGQLLFFSQTLAANYDVSCGTCHHPDFGGSDGLSLSVGVAPFNPSIVGPGREVDPSRDLDTRADGGPNMHRNSITTFNAALFDRSLMFDGRAFVLDESVIAGGHGQAIQTPESGQRQDLEPLDGLLEFTVKGPIVNDNEMRGFAYTNYATPSEYREHLIRRLRGEVDTEYNPKADAAENWLQRFREAFDAPDAAADEVITMLNVQRALAAYIKSKIFVDTPWRDYLEGNVAAVSADAKEGALLFLTPLEDGGLGCAACHAGDRFTDEAFHNVGFPQLGRGFVRADLTDVGRWMVTRNEAHVRAFRTPSLLNVAVTAPYGHAGSFATLDEAVRYHADPLQEVDSFDFSLLQLEQFRTLGMQYPHSEAQTRTALADTNFAGDLLPGRALTSTETRQIVAFLSALTDHCVADPLCVGLWTPRITEDPDGHTVVREQSASRPTDVEAERPTDYSTLITMQYPVLPPLNTFEDVEGCSNRIAQQSNTGEARFLRRDSAAFGIGGRHAYSTAAWFAHSETLEVAMIGGGVTAAYLTADCWLDLAFTAESDMKFFRNLSGTGFEPVELLVGARPGESTGTGVADLNGDYRRELVFGNLIDGAVPVYALSSLDTYERIASLPMVRPTYGISFAPLDASGYPYMYLAHWAGNRGTDGSSPALWRNVGDGLMRWDGEARTSALLVDQRFNFTPRFGDFNFDGRTDLVVASDFKTSMTLRNAGNWIEGPVFENDTDRNVINDDNGMGSTLLDIDNDGVMEWFVTSVFDPSGEAERNWGVTGNRLYRNVSTATRIAFEDITTQAGVRHGYWGWGACAADINNDGFIDLFHVNGFGYIPGDVVETESAARFQREYGRITEPFLHKPPRLFMNNANGTLTESATEWAIDVPSEGRGLACFDYDRDGDIDIVVFDHSSELQFFENQSGSGSGRRFLNIRLVGAAPNTEAIGAKIYVTADVGAGHGVQRQLRHAEASSQFNSQNVPDLHFGLGHAETVSTLQVVWPNGNELTCSNVASNQFIVLDQRDGGAACPVQ